MGFSFKILLFTGVLAFFSCDKHVVEKKDTSVPSASQNPKSVEKVGNNYRINLNIIEQNLNKKDLTKNLESKDFSEIVEANSIPLFIQTFLKEAQFVDDFKMAAKDEEWQNGSLCNLVPKLTGKKYYNVALHDSIDEVQLVQRNLPNKKLIYCGSDANCLIIACYNGGRSHSSQIAIVQFSGTTIENYWFDYSSEVVSGKQDLIQKLKAKRLPKIRERFRGC